MTATVHDVIIVGAGLAGGLLARRLAERRPELKVLLLDAADSFPRTDRNWTWSFHSTDLETEHLGWMRPWVSRAWSGYDVKFPDFERGFDGRPGGGTSYYSLTSGDFDTRLASVCEVRSGSRACRVTDRSVELETGERFEAGCVIDARGDGASLSAPSCAFQKFLGLEVELEEDSGLSRPLLMDATIQQGDEFRFFYLLPWGTRSLLIENTRYSRDASLDPAELEREIRDYAQAHGWTISRVQRREYGSLPIPFEPASPLASKDSAPRIGTAGEFFHPTTGYSLPGAVRVAWRLAELPVLDPAQVRTALRDLKRQGHSAHKFYRFLNRLWLTRLPAVTRPWIMREFYRLPSGIIERFYAGVSNWRDVPRILAKGLFWRSHVARLGS